MPIKDSRDFYSLGDITANGESLDGHIINILAAVQSVRFQQYTASPHCQEKLTQPGISVWWAKVQMCFLSFSMIEILSFRLERRNSLQNLMDAKDRG